MRFARSDFTNAVALCFCTVLFAAVASFPAKAVDITEADFAGEPRNPKYHAFVYGAWDYDGIETGNLPSAEKDVEVISAALQNAGYRVNTAETRHASDVSQVVKAYREFVKGCHDGNEDANCGGSADSDRMQTGDVILIYFSGHGFSIDGVDWTATETFNNTNIDSREIAKDAVKLPFFIAELNKNDISAGTIVFVLDACRTQLKLSDKSGNEIANQLPKPRSKQLVLKTSDLAELLSNDRVSVLIAPTAEDGVAVSSLISGRASPFTDALVKAIRISISKVDTLKEEISANIGSDEKADLARNERVRFRELVDTAQKFYSGTLFSMGFTGKELFLSPTNTPNASAPPIKDYPYSYIDNEKWGPAFWFATKNDSIDPLKTYLIAVPWGRYRNIAERVYRKYEAKGKISTDVAWLNPAALAVAVENISQQSKPLIALATRKSVFEVPQIIDAETTRALSANDLTIYQTGENAEALKQAVRDLTAEIERQNGLSYDALIAQKIPDLVLPKSYYSYEGPTSNQPSIMEKLVPGTKVDILASAEPDSSDALVELTSGTSKSTTLVERLQVTAAGNTEPVWIENQLDNKTKDGVVGRPLAEFTIPYDAHDLEARISEIMDISGLAKRKLSYVLASLPDFGDDSYNTSLSEFNFYGIIRELAKQAGRENIPSNAITGNGYTDDKNIKIQVFGF